MKWHDASRELPPCNDHAESAYLACVSGDQRPPFIGWYAGHSAAWLDGLGESFRTFSGKLMSSLSLVFAEAEALGRAWYGMAEQSYLRHHRRLPGSLRRCRLRKKRRTVVLAWFERHLKVEVVRVEKA